MRFYLIGLKVEVLQDRQGQLFFNEHANHTKVFKVSDSRVLRLINKLFQDYD